MSFQSTQAAPLAGMDARVAGVSGVALLGHPFLGMFAGLPSSAS